MFIQIGLGMLLTFSRTAFLSYTLWKKNFNKIILSTHAEVVLDRISLLIYYINFAKAFFVNILTSPLFRHVFRKTILHLFAQINPRKKVF
jgi:hypothetical protein